MQLQLDGMKPVDGETTFSEILASLGVTPGPKLADRFGDALKEWANKSIARPIRTLSLFSGAGGLDIAFHDAGFQILESVEIEKKFAATLENNSETGGYFEGTKVNCIDIRDFSMPKASKIDFIIGGPPCQTFSSAGRRANGVLGITDQRGTLFQEYVRLLNELKPKGFLFENVYGITGADNGNVWEEIKDAFAQAGYTISYRVLDAADYGVPQHRERMFIVGVKKGKFCFPLPTHGPDSLDCQPFTTAHEALKGVSKSHAKEANELKGRYGHLLKDIPEGLNYSFFTEKMGHPNPIFGWRSKFSDFLYKADRNKPVRTIKAQGGQYTGPFHWSARPFTVNEMKRLQTFPDRFELVGGRQVAVHQIGNSVPCQIGRILALSIMQQVFELQMPFRLPLMDDSHKLGFRTRKRELNSHYRVTAQDAIALLAPQNSLPKRLKKYKRVGTVSSNFNWVEDDTATTIVDVSIGNSKWEFNASSVLGTDKKVCSPFLLRLIPDSILGWGLEGVSVKMSGTDLDENQFRCLWKLFENQLISQGIKADLVQLAEYYQYESRFITELDTKTIPSKRWGIVSKVLRGELTREIHHTSVFEKDWSMNTKGVMETMVWLRSLGYEIRNSNTNPQIPKNSFLIPYSFPSLTGSSVQTSKNLGKSNV